MSWEWAGSTGPAGEEGLLLTPLQRGSLGAGGLLEKGLEVRTAARGLSGALGRVHTHGGTGLNLQPEHPLHQAFCEL